MDWVHCNNCFLLPDCEKVFFLTSCGHIFCRDCEESCARGQCKLCGNQCTTITLSSTMKPDVQIYFTDPDDLLKKKIKEVQQVSEFQKNHRARLMAHQRKQLKKFKALKEDFRKLIKNLKDLDGDRKKLLQENGVMKKFLTMQRGTPTSNPGSAQRSEKGYKSSYDNISPHSNLNTVLTKFADNRMENSKSYPNLPQRMCVISPPMNGKMGVIPSTPSPSSSLRKLNLSHSNAFQNRRNMSQYDTPDSTPGGISDNYGIFATPQSSGISPINSYTSSSDFNLKNPPYKRDVRKLVVHPYSPDD